MAKKPESRLQKKIREALEKAFPFSFWIKIWTGPFQAVGFPDLLGCVEGHFFAFEVKMPGEEPTEKQRRMLRLIRKAGGTAKVVYSPDEALAAVRKTLQASKEGR